MKKEIVLLLLGLILATPLVIQIQGAETVESATGESHATVKPDAGLVAGIPGEVTSTEDIQVPPPPFSEGIFPCMDCHSEMKPNPKRRQLEDYHQEIILRHGEKSRWCLDCHDEQNRDVLRLASGETIPFEESYRLCGQCHGLKLRDWKAGVHGKRTGRWDGKERRYLLCVHCHWPHQPRFPAIKPMPKPISPGELRQSLALPYTPIILESGLPKRATDEHAQ
jgi:hypothetical protein